jgi:hypothetical protein
VRDEDRLRQSRRDRGRRVPDVQQERRTAHGRRIHPGGLDAELEGDVDRRARPGDTVDGVDVDLCIEHCVAGRFGMEPDL